MDRLVIVKFHASIANRWLFMVQIKIVVIIPYSKSYFDMLRGSFSFGHSVHSVQLFNYTPWAIKNETLIFSITQTNIDRFS